MPDLEHKIDELRAEIRKGFKEVRTEFENVRSEVKDLRDEVQAGFKEMRVELRDVRADAHAEVVELRSDMNARFVGIERLTTALWISLTGGMAAFVAALIATNL